MAASGAKDDKLRLQLSAEQRDEFLVTFEELDEDNSGKIDTAEVKKALESVGMTVTDREVTGIVERFDVNGDGELDKDEWLELAAIMFLGKGERELKNETFAKFDTDKKGFVTAEDIRTFASGMGKTFDFSFEDMIAACKPATEGQLSRSEFDTLFSVLFPDVGKKAQPKRAPRKA